ncbi:hypothetical protein DXG03_001251 [Asterophora parasitica]|uniref:DUF1996 domain-containing protein n=1 Tax=Asterophora parasitica TaxID=117018 RepID=A0A9P7G3Q6_9AGAR|nr:hypothetical protein DXG03_001251 [Asterophora parasitica]
MKALILLSAISAANAYWLMGIENFITTERLDPIVSPGGVAGHVHSVLGASNFGAEVTTAKLRESQCTSIPIAEDKSNYWFPHLYFQWANGSFTSLTGGAVMYVPDLFQIFRSLSNFDIQLPEQLLHSLTMWVFNFHLHGLLLTRFQQFRMLSGNPTYRSLDPNNIEQTAISFLCLDFNGQTTHHTSIPNKACPSGIRAQVNFQSCWDGKNLDSPDHKSHVAYRSGGADVGSCTDPKFPVTLPRVFIEVYWGSNQFDQYRSQAKNNTQPFVYVPPDMSLEFAHGDPTGYGYHADFINGWDTGVLQKAVDGCNCNPYGDPTCCAQKGIFTLTKDQNCYITKSVDEVVTGTIPKLPGNNPVVGDGPNAVYTKDPVTPGIIKPVYVYTSGQPTATGSVVIPPKTDGGSYVAPYPVTSSAANGSSYVAPYPVPSSAANGGSYVAPYPVPSSAANGGSYVAPYPVPSSAANGGSYVAPYPVPSATVASASTTAASSFNAVVPPAVSPSIIKTSSVAPPVVSSTVVKTSSVTPPVVPTLIVKPSNAAPPVTTPAPPAITPKPSPSPVKTVTVRVTKTVEKPVYKTKTVYKTVTVYRPASTSAAKHYRRAQRLGHHHE